MNKTSAILQLLGFGSILTNTNAQTTPIHARCIPFKTPTIIMQKIVISLFLILIVATVSFAQISKKQMDGLHLPWIHFDWQGDSLAHRYFDKAAILIPVKIDNLPYAFSMQLDLGAQSTMVYERTLEPYLQISKELNQKIDTTHNPVFINSQPCPLFHHINLTLDKILFPDLSIALYKNFGDLLTLDSIKTSSSRHIGTIGTDIFQNKILLIDYPNQRICLINSLPDPVTRKASFVTAKIDDGRITLPFTVDSEQKDIMFDTGSSIFSILTSSENSINFTRQNQPILDSLIGEQWGHQLKVYGKRITKKIKLGNRKMPSGYVYYLTNKSQKTLEDELKIIGLTGNAYFLKNILIIDYSKGKFGIL